MLVGPAACQNGSPRLLFCKRWPLLATGDHQGTALVALCFTPTLDLLRPTGNLCPEPDVLTVGAGAFIAPGVDFFTHGNTGHRS